MGGHGHHHIPGNENNIPESDEELVNKIRNIELIKHNPNLFHVWAFNPVNVFNILGGLDYTLCAGFGTYFGYWYYAQKLKINPETFYARIFHRSSRMFLGFAVGSAIGYMKFGDRQRLHNAWVAERLRRRYAESLELDTKDLWKYKGVRANHEFYRW
eukprot:CAMPEP_0170544932 /NCGR_PEP_ID=MMETSP0211-20121228/3508_1 /TAXON_ID=311385 /ORGANISM="Pseudokeronopsis sp., Strain OXSARD2" /LENGTH=156 /DNA_ID=CAMNT_0010848701 /DNA_START=12 /DNA_END=479 /DNA_ORIENTATION=+